MICLKYLKPNMKTYIYETTNYFGLTEGEFKAQYFDSALMKKQQNYQIHLELKRER